VTEERGRRTLLKTSQGSAQPSQELAVVLAAFEATELLLPALEPGVHLIAWRTEGAAGVYNFAGSDDDSRGGRGLGFDLAFAAFCWSVSSRVWSPSSVIVRVLGP
jgi:hypothetical protein